jgi:uncharacterized membrane protein
MYSKIKVLGHPLHPMLVGFPVAFYTATLVAFIVYAAGSNPFWYRVGCVANWAGVVTAAVAAVPGFLDWALGVPRRSPAKKTGLIHMGLNVASLTSFLVNAIVVTNHWDEALPPTGAGIPLSAIGVLLTLPAGFLGWSMVQDHHVGVRLSHEQERLEPVNEPASHERGRPTSPLASH